MVGESEQNWRGSMIGLRDGCLNGDIDLEEFLVHEANINAYISAVQKAYMVIGLIVGWRKLGSLLPFDEEVNDETE